MQRLFEDVERSWIPPSTNWNIRYPLQFFSGIHIQDVLPQFLRGMGQESRRRETARSLGQIKEYIISSVRNKLTGREVATVDWKKDEGKQVTEGVLKETLDVFGVTE